MNHFSDEFLIGISRLDTLITEMLHSRLQLQFKMKRIVILYKGEIFTIHFC